MNLIESFKQEVSQKVAGPDEDLQAPNVAAIMIIATTGIRKISFIFIGLCPGKNSHCLEYLKNLLLSR